MESVPRGRGRPPRGRGRPPRGRGRAPNSSRRLNELRVAVGSESNVGTVQNAAMTEKKMLSYGLSLVGFPTERQRCRESLSVARFRSFFGIGPKALSALFNDLIQLKKLEKNDINSFLMTMNWLKCYDVEHNLAGRWGLGEEYIRNKVKEISKFIQQLKETKIVWGGFGEEEVFIASVDGVHFKIQEPRKDPGSKWYDHKSNSSGVSYEVSIAIRRNQVVWIKGPFHASTHDITIFRGGRKKESPKDPNSLINMIPEGKKIIGDSGLTGEPEKISVTRPGDSADVKKFKARVKSRQETFNSRLKSFNILGNTFRHGFGHHQMAFEAVCVACQYDLENGNGLFEV